MAKNNKSDELENALIKKALGYSVKEITKEYSANDDNKIVLTKKKVTEKHIPPDNSAAKVLLEHFKDKYCLNFDMLSDEELISQKDKLQKYIESIEEEEDATN